MVGEDGLAEVTTAADLARLLRELRRRQARRTGGAVLTYRDLAARTGWSLGSIAAYLAGKALPPTDRWDVLVWHLGATPAERGALATARDRVEELRRGGLPAGEEPGTPRQLPPAVPGVVGRERQLAELDALLHAGPA